MTSDSALVPGPLRGAVWLLRGEAAALGLLAAYLIYADLTSTASDLVNALFVTAFTAGGALVLWLLGAALGRLRSGARAPAIVLQLMLLPVGYYMIQGGLAWLGIPLMALGVLVVGLLVCAPTNRALGVG
ncbi:hypothetical protein [Micromonospora pisi]|uniref:hypothetical protein n=1 Tax=Micromonospora pisi TaxID=589240 RepID=UPI000EAFB1AC